MVMAITIIVITMIIQRKEVDLARKAAQRLLIYGRRKVGKTYLSKNFLDHDIYVYVKRGGGTYIEGGKVSVMESYDQFIDTLELWIDSNKKIIIDEFQRLPDDFLDRLQFIGDRGRIILTGSSFHTVKEVISPASPILGSYSELRLSLISPVDIFRALKENSESISAYSLSPYLRDPWTMQYYSGEGTRVSDILMLSRGTLRSLIGEVFLEEKKTLSQTYEGIIRGLALGKWKMGLLADLLYARKIIDKQDPHLIRPYFNNMEEMDLVNRLPLYKSRNFLYRITSPVIELGFMLDEKYNFFQSEIKTEVLEKELKEQLPRHIEQFTGELMAELLGGTFNFFISSDFDIDIIITRGRKTLAVGEVKWKERVSKKEIGNFKERVKYFKCRKYLISKRPINDNEIISITPDNILELEAI